MRREEQRGTAFLEFMIALPFLLALILGLFDITVALNEYFFLADAVKAGAQRAMTAPNLVRNLQYASGPTISCSGANDKSSDLIHGRVANLINLHNRSLSELCIISERLQASDPSNADTVLVQAQASYEAIFPLFKGITISAQVRVPYLLNTT